MRERAKAVASYAFDCNVAPAVVRDVPFIRELT